MHGLELDGSRAALLEWDKVPKVPSWHEINLGASPVITCDARAETWGWSPPGAEPRYSWVAHNDKPFLMLQWRQQCSHSSATLTCNLWTNWKLNLQIQWSFLWHSLTPLISGSECNLQGWAPELVGANRHSPLALTAPRSCVWHWLPLIAELCHQVCRYVPRRCRARRWHLQQPASQCQWQGWKWDTDSPGPLLCPADRTLQGFLPVVNCVRFYLWDRFKSKKNKRKKK